MQSEDDLNAMALTDYIASILDKKIILRYGVRVWGWCFLEKMLKPRNEGVSLE